MTEQHLEIHRKAIADAKTYNQSERDLLLSLEQVDDRKIYLELGHPSLFQYCLRELKLTESQAAAMISVMRKAKSVPELKVALDTGELNVSRSKRVLSVMTKDNAPVWIEKAKTLTQRELELEVVRVNPKAVPGERITALTENRSELRLAISPELEAKLCRVQELVSQKEKRPCSLEDALETLTQFYLQKKDPATAIAPPPSLRNADRRQAPSGRPLTRAIPRSLRNRALIRDRGQCTHLDSRGERCGSRHWVEVHHVMPFARGGDHSLSNLTTLCYGHHRAVHVPAAVTLQ